jgi:putative transposase
MKYNPDIHHRRSIRLKHYDYSQEGAYVVTVCTNDKEWLFGDVINGEMQLNDMGNVTLQCWKEIPKHFPNAVLDEFIVMPNHIHGIVIFNAAGAKNISPLQHGTSMTIGSVIRGFKIGVTKWARANGASHDPWQRNYYEHIIRNQPELNKIREYIINNLLNWETDENYSRS